MARLHTPPKKDEQEMSSIAARVMAAAGEEINQFLSDHINIDYYSWTKFRNIMIPSGYTHEDLWYTIKALRLQNRREIHIGKYQFSFQIPNFLLQKLHYIDLHLGGSISLDELIPHGDEIRYLRSSLIEEAIASSQIEGAATTRQRAKEMIEYEQKPENHDEQMIMNNFLAMQYISEHKDEDIDQEKILTLHQILTDGTLEETNDEGRFRQSDDIHVVDTLTGDIIHSPVAHEEIVELMGEFIHIFNSNIQDNDYFIHPIVQGVIIHFLIGWIHPFVDGNGRTARGLFYWYIIKNGYWLAEYVSISQSIKKNTAQYKNAYLHTEIDDNDLTYFIEYNIKCLFESLDDYRQYLQRKIQEQKNIDDIVGKNHLTDRQASILTYFLKNRKTYTIADLVSVFDVTRNTLKKDIDILVRYGMIQKIQVDAKTTTYRGV